MNVFKTGFLECYISNIAKVFMLFVFNFFLQFYVDYAINPRC